MVFALFDGVVDTLGDVWRLLADGQLDSAGVAIETLVGVVVADAENNTANEGHQVGVGVSGDLTGEVDLAGGQQRLDGNPASGIIVEECIEHGVRNLIGHLVGVALGHGLRGEQAPGHVLSFRRFPPAGGRVSVPAEAGLSGTAGAVLRGTSPTETPILPRLQGRSCAPHGRAPHPRPWPWIR